MRIHAVVPLKAPARGKSRLAGAIAEAPRVRLIRTMLEHVVTVVAAVPALERVSVLTKDAALVPRGAAHLDDPGGDLNEALALAVRAHRDAGADMLLIVAADLPLVRAEEIGALVQAVEANRGGVIAAPDWRDAGTNALAVPLAPGLRTHFGPGSLIAHEACARAAHLTWTLVRRPGLAYDLDEPAQLPGLARTGGERYAFLAAALDACAIIPPA